MLAACTAALSQQPEDRDEPEEPPSDRWRQVAGTDNASFYLRRAPIEIIDKLARAWVLTNLAEPEFDSYAEEHYRSTLDLEEHDCREKRRRTLQSTAYTESSSRGTTVYTSTKASEWRYSMPDTVSERINSEVCKAFRRQTAARAPKKPAAGGEKPAELKTKAPLPVEKL